MVQRGDRRLLGTMLRTLLGYCDYPYGRRRSGTTTPRSMASRNGSASSRPQNLSETVVRPKEQALIDRVTAEVDAGRQCWVFTTMTDKYDTVARLERLMQINGFKVKVLRSSVGNR